MLLTNGGESDTGAFFFHRNGIYICLETGNQEFRHQDKKAILLDAKGKFTSFSGAISKNCYFYLKKGIGLLYIKN